MTLIMHSGNNYKSSVMMIDNMSCSCIATHSLVFKEGVAMLDYSVA